MRPTLYTADWVLPVTTTPLRDGGVLVDEQGVIAAVGPVTAISAGDDVLRVPLGPALLLPGLVNVHAHPELAGMRGLLEDLPFHEWIPSLRAAKEGAPLDDADFAAAARATCIEAVAAGITTLGATEDSGAALTALAEAGLRGIVYREVFGPAPGQADSALEGLRRRVDEMRANETELVRVGVSPHAPYTVSDELFRSVAEYARSESLPVAVHAAESAVEADLVDRGAGTFASGLRARGIDTPRRARSTIQLLHDTGVLACRPLLIHCVQIDARDIELIAAAGAAVAHCPVANARLGHGIAPVSDLLDAGVTVGLGSDSVASNNRIDIIAEARIAQLMQRARLRSPFALPAIQLLRMMTIDAARAIGLEHRIGSLEAGKDADLCAVQIDAAHARPVHDPLATLLFSTRGSDVVLTVVRGRVVYGPGAAVTIDAGAVLCRLDESAERLRSARDRARGI